MKKGLEQTYDKYELGKEKITLAHEKGMYGLKKKQAAEFEGDINTWLASFKQGGKVPNKQTFSDVLSRIPDAGGS